MFKKSFNLLVVFLLIFVVCSYGQEGKQVIPLTTKSEEALGYYKKALMAIHQVYEKDAVENFKKAIEADPEFVMAMAYYSILLNNPDNQKMIDRAKKYFDEVTEGERMFTQAMEAVIKNDSAKERKILEALAAKYPDDAQVHLRLVGNYYFAKEFDKTIEEAKKLLACEQNSY
jgi:tetratricopeptide (TPR) repeat protein